MNPISISAVHFFHKSSFHLNKTYLSSVG